MKVTFLIVPATKVTLFAGAMTAEPPPEGVNVIETLDGKIVPVGKPLPRRVMVVIPACPEDGVIEESDIDAAETNAPAELRMVKRKIETNRKGFLR